jgi:hypothetical protein
MSDSLDDEPRAGAVDPELAAELPGLRLRWIRAQGDAGLPSPSLRARLRELSDRGRGVDAVALRTRPLPRAYRAFFRQIGLDPDVDRVPAERVALRRLLEGHLTAENQIAGACRLAVVETGVGVWALDGAAVAPAGPEIRVAADGQATPGSLLVADARTVHADLFGEPRPGSAPGPGTREVVLYCVGVAGVPEIHLHEALWQARDALVW